MVECMRYPTIYKRDLMHKVYLAGPTVFFPDAVQVYERLKKVCADFGLEGVAPVDGDPIPVATPAERAQYIYMANARKVAECTAVLADVNPFRGAFEPDSGTCVEIGMALALGKPVAGYRETAATPMAEVLRGTLGAYWDLNGREMDLHYDQEIEDFGLSVNLMIGAPCPVFPCAYLAIKNLAEKLGTYQAAA